MTVLEQNLKCMTPAKGPFKILLLSFNSITVLKFRCFAQRKLCLDQTVYRKNPSAFYIRIMVQFFCTFRQKVNTPKYFEFFIKKFKNT